MRGRLEGKITLITGASGGLGLVDAMEFNREGAKMIIMISNNKEELKKAQVLVKKYGDAEILAYTMDVSNEEQWKRTMEQLRDRISHLDVFVNNAGINKRDTYEDCTLEDWNRIVAVNQTGVFLGMKYGVNLLKKSEGASLINMSSITGLTGYFAVAYTASKWAVRGMTKSAAMEFGKWGIRVNSVHPGFIHTPLNEDIQKVIELSNDMNGLERAGDPHEVAKAVVFLASDDSSYMTGSELVIDGGLTAGGQFKAIGDQLNIY